MNVLTRWVLVIVVAAGLGIDAYQHFHVAHNYAFTKTSSLSEATLFRVEAVAAVVAAVLVVVWASRWSAAIALAVAGGGLFVLVLYRYVDVGTLGPLPNMYEPTWEVPGKKASVVGEVIAIVGSLALFAHSAAAARRRRVAA